MTLFEALQLSKRHLKLFIIVPLLFMVAMGACSFVFMSDEYTASTSMYILARSDSPQGSVSNNDLSTSQLIANDIAELAQSERVTSNTESALGLDDLSDYTVSVAGESTTRLINVTVTGPNAQMAADVANEIASNTSQVAQEVMSVDSIKVVDKAKPAKKPSGPNRPKLMLLAAAGGLMVVIGYLLVQDAVDTRIRNAQDAEETLGLPVIGRIPAVKGGR